MKDTAVINEDSVQNPEKRHGRLYWILKNIRHRAWTFFKRHWLFCIVATVGSIGSIFGFRGLLHPYAIYLREHIFVVTFGVPLAFLLIVMLRKSTWFARSAVAMLVIGAVGLVAWSDLKPHRYMALYVLHGSLKIVDIDKLPLTGHERIQPRESLRTLAGAEMGETERFTDPHFVRDGDEYFFTMAIEPRYWQFRFSGNVRQIVRILATTPSPDFSSRNRIDVNFDVSPSLLWGKSSYIATVKTLSLWRYFNYEPSDVRFIRNDDDEWVEVVSFIRWSGWFFPRPEFGGVQVISQVSDKMIPFDSWAHSLRRMIFGSGTWIPPERIKEHKYLRRQNVHPDEVSRYIAESLRFQDGFWAPFPGRHVGDVRIPDLPGDENDQPFTTYFGFDPSVAEEKPYDYFAMEPYSPELQGLSASLFVPADGIGPVLRFRSSQEGYTGVSAASEKIMDSKKNYDWTQTHPAEFRPYVVDIAGSRRPFWITTIVTDTEIKSEPGATGAPSGKFIAGSPPEVALLDLRSKTVIWVESLNPADWPEQIERELRAVRAIE